MNLRIRNLIRGRSDRNNETGLIDAVSALREKLSAKDYGAFHELMIHIPEAQRTALGILPVRGLSRLHQRVLYSRVDLQKEIMWASLLLNASSRLINMFLDLNKRLAAETMKGDYAGATRILEKIESFCGLSLFGIEARLALLQLGGGLEQQRNYANEIEKKGKRSFSAFVGHHSSRRNEENISLARFSQRFSKLISRWDLEEHLVHYVEYRILGKIPESNEGLADLLRHEQTASIIDLYETFLVVIRTALARDALDHGSLARLLFQFNKLGFDDPRWHALLALQGDRLGVRTQITGLPDFAHYFYQGQYDNSHSCSIGVLNHDPANTGALLFAARALVIKQGPSPSGRTPVDRLLGMLMSVLARDASAERSIANLSKLCLNLRFVPATMGVIASALLAFKPRGLGESDTELAVMVAQGWPDIAGMQQFHHLDGVADVCQAMAPERLAERQVIEHLSSNNLENALAAAVALSKSPMASDQLDGYVWNAWIQYLNGQLDDVIDFVAQKSCAHDDICLAFPIHEIISQIGQFKHVRKKLHRLSVVILVHLEYRRAQSQDNRNHVRWACDEFLANHNLERPSLISHVAAQFDEKQVLYFLREICTTDTLQSVRGLKTSRAADEERMNICSLLVTLDPTRADVYREEIKFLTTQMMIEEGVQIVDRSRLFVNIDGITKWADQELRDLFDIYISRRGTSDEKSKREFESAIRELVTERKPLSVQYLELPRDDDHSILVGMVQDLHEQYLRNPEHGLDYYLSMRVRHGTLSGTLRGPLEERRLLTTFDSKAGRYRENEYWVQRSIDDSQSIGRILGEFSERYDVLVDSEIKSQLYIKKEGNVALIGNPLPPLMFNIIRHSISEDSTFDEFLAICYSLFKQALGEELSFVRTQLETRFARGLQELMQSVMAQLNEVMPEHCWIDLRSALTMAKNEAMNSLLKVIDWLHLEDVGNLKNSFTVQQIVDVALESARRTLRGFSPKVSTTLAVEPRMGVSVLSTVADIIFITMENIYKHSKVFGQPWVKISVTNRLNEFLEIEVRSEVGPGACTNEAEDILAEIRDMIRSTTYHSRVAKEGRSGLIKIKRMVGHERDTLFSFGFDADRQFIVTVKLKIVYIADQDRIELLAGAGT